MKQDLREDRGWVVFGLVLGVVAYALSGCSGVEVGGRLGVYRVDTRAERSETYRESVPLACYLWRDCSNTTEETLK